MKLATLVFVVLLCAFSRPLLAAPPPDAAFITMEGPGFSMAPIDQVISVTAEGEGHIYHAMPVHTGPTRDLSGCCLIGTVTPAQEPVVRALPFVTGLYRGLADPAVLALMGEEAVFAGEAWNFLLMGGGEEPPPPEAEPFPNDMLGPLENGELAGKGPQQSSETRGLVGSPGQYQTSEFMIRRVAIGVVLPESTGSGENWSTARQTDVFNRIVVAANWWGTQGGTSAGLTFFYDQRFSVSTTYEPITVNANTPTGSDGLWISDVLTNMNYSGLTHYAQCYAYDNAIRTSYGTDWTFAIFVADSLNDLDGKFPDGWCAYSYVHGPYMVMTYDNATWTISSMQLVCAHEIGHTFGAADEYNSPPPPATPTYKCQCLNYGYLNVYNGNCVNCTGSQVQCVMRDNKQYLCSYTKGQVGWRDSFPFNGIYDPVDTTPSVSWANLSYGPTSPYWGKSWIQGQGQVVDSPYPSPTRTPVTINKVQASYIIDGGSLIGAIPTDGAFDSDIEAFSFTSSSQPDGLHTVTIQANNTVGSFSVLLPQPQIIIDTTPPPGPPGFVRCVQGPYSSDPTQAHADFGTGPTDPESGIAGYQFDLYQQGNPVPLATQYCALPFMPPVGWWGLSLAHGGVYYINVSGINGAGLSSQPTTSFPNLTIDLTPPGSPTPVVDGGAGTDQFDRLSFSWTAAPDDVSPIYDYQVDICDDLLNWIYSGLSGGLTNCAATGLTLVPGSRYYCYVTAINGTGAYGPFAVSDGIMAVTFYSSIGAAKKTAGLNSAVGLNNVYVTSNGSDQPGVVYVEEGNRSAGIRTDSTDTHAKGAKVQAAGKLQLNGNQELYLSNSEVAAVGGSQTIKPVGLRGSALGGGAFGVQPGVTGGSGLNTIGLLAKIWGSVTYATTSPPHYFVVDDGSGLLDPAGWQGVGCYSGSISPPSAGTFVSVTGLSSLSAGCPVVLLRQTGDWR